MRSTTWPPPSPAIVVAVLALVAALAGTAVAEQATTSAKPVTKKKVKKIVNKLAPGLSVAHAETANTANSANTAESADNANALGGQGASAFQTRSASDQSSTSMALTTANQTVLSTNITLPSTKAVTAVASIEALGGVSDSMNCNLRIAGTDGVRQTVELNPASTGHPANLPLTQARTVGAGTRAVDVECNEGGGDNVSVDDRSLSVVATG